jgi:GGDEF domain-containing protein
MLEITVAENGGQTGSLPIHMSIGLSASDEVEPDEVMKAADSLMYAAKERYYAERNIKRG